MVHCLKHGLLIYCCSYSTPNLQSVLFGLVSFAFLYYTVADEVFLAIANLFNTSLVNSTSTDTTNSKFCSKQFQRLKSLTTLLLLLLIL